MKVEQTECSGTSYKILTPGNYPEESIQHSEHGKSLKSRMWCLLLQMCAAVYKLTANLVGL